MTGEVLSGAVAVTNAVVTSDTVSVVATRMI
jgi:hypothetical protein